MTGYNNNTIARDGSIRDSPVPLDGLNIDSNAELMEESEKKRKRLSLQEQPASSSSSQKGKQRAATMGAIRTSPEQDDLEDGVRKGKGKSSGLAGFTSCEACRRGKRRCEPSPLVPPDHPDAARLPCARCRRFAIECVRVRAVRRKGPAPVAVSDAAHGYSGSAGPSSRRISGVSEVGYDSERMTNTSAFNSPGPPAIAASLEGIEEVVSGPVIDNVLGLFFDYVYPLTPCLHRPTFVSNLAARRDRSDPTFCALTLTIIASTLVQVPRALMNLDKAEVERLARKCIAVAREKMAIIWEDPTPITSTMTHIITTAQANQLALAMRINEETTRSKAKCDDGYIGSGRRDDHIRWDLSPARGHPFSYRWIQRRNGPIPDLRERTLQISLKVPDHLKLRNAYDSRSASPAFDWETKLRDRFIDYFRSAAEGAHALNSFLVMQGNILVTQQVVRLVLLQTRQALLSQLAMYTPIMPSTALQEEQAEDIACELLDGLNSLPVECLMETSNESGATKSQKLLMQFLSVLSVIEGMYTFGKDISAE
ncbi:hypothetical protein IAT40_006979 [Kwoniella sp. CBS 6097]